MSLKNIFIIFCLCFAVSISALGEGLCEEELLQYLQQNYTPSSTLGYSEARDVLYSTIDIKPGNELSGIYSGFTITLDPNLDPSTDAYNKGINCEHTFPQSMGAGSEPQKSDMHHLFPCKSNVNSSRGNNPFGEIPDADTDKWYFENTVLTSIPGTNVELYAEKENDGFDRFEPREEVKGDIARAMFYFYCIYNNAADDDFFEVQKDVLLQWHKQDPADESETARTWQIASYQHDLPNPFIIDESLVERIWFHLDQPQISHVTVSSNNITVNWEVIEEATSYNLFTSDDPYAPFPSGWTQLQTNISLNQITVQTSEARKFFRVNAVE